MTNKYGHIPITHAPAEKLPAGIKMKLLPAGEWEESDIVMLSREGVAKLFRIKRIERRDDSEWITFTLYPIDGGRPEKQMYLPHRWKLIGRGV